MTSDSEEGSTYTASGADMLRVMDEAKWLVRDAMRCSGEEVEVEGVVRCRWEVLCW